MSLGTAFRDARQQVRRKIFISYHHGGDQPYYDRFSGVFGDTYEIIYDNSLERRIDSDNVEYVMRHIRENYVTGSSCTLVLCGINTAWRKYVDWEIKATLDMQHGLMGIKLPTLEVVNNGCLKPARLQDNVDSGYAVWTSWEDVTNEPAKLAELIELARGRSSALIKNNRERRLRNG